MSFLLLYEIRESSSFAKLFNHENRHQTHIAGHYVDHVSVPLFHHLVEILQFFLVKTVQFYLARDESDLIFCPFDSFGILGGEVFGVGL